MLALVRSLPLQLVQRLFLQVPSDCPVRIKPSTSSSSARQKSRQVLLPFRALRENQGLYMSESNGPWSRGLGGDP